MVRCVTAVGFPALASVTEAGGRAKLDAMSVRALVVAAVLTVGARAARADEVPGATSEAEAALATAARLADEAAQLADTARDVRDLLYYLNDPRGFRYDFYQANDQLQRDLILGPLVRNLAALYSHRKLELTLEAQTMADTATPASAAIGGGIVWDAPLCRLFEAQGSGQGFYDDGELRTAAAWGVAGCLPLPFNTLEMGYRGRRQVRRSLLAIPIADGERASGDTIYANLRFYRWLSNAHQIDVAPMQFQFDWARTGVTTFQSYGSIAPVHWARRGRGFAGRDQTYDFMRFAFTTLGVYDEVTDPLTVAFSPLAIDGVRLGDDVAIGLDVGWASSQWGAGITTVSKNGVHLDLTVVGGIGPATVEIHAKNVAQPTLSNLVLDEQRLTATVDLERTAAWIRADGFASRARLRAADRDSARAWTWGAGLDATVALTSKVFVYGRAEAARNLVLDAAATTPSTAFDVRGTVGVTASLRQAL